MNKQSNYRKFVYPENTQFNLNWFYFYKNCLQTKPFSAIRGIIRVIYLLGKGKRHKFAFKGIGFIRLSILRIIATPFLCKMECFSWHTIHAMKNVTSIKESEDFPRIISYYLSSSIIRSYISQEIEIIQSISDDDTMCLLSGDYYHRSSTPCIVISNTVL